MSHLRERLDRRLGPRGRMLLWFALIWSGIGVGVTGGLGPDGPGLIHLLIPEWIRVTMWLGPACYALVAAWRPNDQLAFSLLAVAPLVRGTSLAWGWVVDVTPIPGPGYPGGLYNSLFYLGLLTLLWIVSGFRTQNGGLDAAH